MNCANHPDRERQAFCQNCGKPLCRECARTVGQAVFCEPCLEERLAAANAAQPTPSASSTAGIPGLGSATFGSGPGTGSAAYQSAPGSGQGYQYVGTAEGIPYNVSGARPRPGTPNPAVAALLGLIPGVGAMYNGQYAKGIVHLIIFAILVSLADSHGIFGLFVAAWIFYQAIEAYHTANARREGTSLPNPFGLNDIGERFGFGRAWPGPSATPTVPPATPDWTRPATPPSTPYPGPANAPAASYGPAPVSPAANPYAAPEPTPRPDYSGAAWSVPDPFRPVNAPGNPVAPIPTPPASSPLPIGAIVLIALGLLFLVGNTRWLGSLPIHILLPVLLIGFGVWLFVRRMLSYGAGLTDDGTPGYHHRVLQALQGSVWVVLVGVLFLLDSLRILSWGRSWPLFIIVAGVVIFLRRSTANSLPPVPAPPVVPGAPYTGVGMPQDPPITRNEERP